MVLSPPVARSYWWTRLEIKLPGWFGAGYGAGRQLTSVQKCAICAEDLFIEVGCPLVDRVSSVAAPTVAVSSKCLTDIIVADVGIIAANAAEVL